MYYPGRHPAKPWRISRNYANFRPDKMTSEVEKKWWKGFRSFCHKRYRSHGNDAVMRREQRKQQRRLNAYLSCPYSEEWDI